MPIRVDEDGLGGEACICKTRLDDQTRSGGLQDITCPKLPVQYMATVQRMRTLQSQQYNQMIPSTRNPKNNTQEDLDDSSVWMMQLTTWAGQTSVTPGETRLASRQHHLVPGAGSALTIVTASNYLFLSFIFYGPSPTFIQISLYL